MVVKIKEFSKFISSMCITFGGGTLIFNMIFICVLSNIPYDDFMMSIPFGIIGLFFGGIAKDKKLIYGNIGLIILRLIIINIL